MKTKIKKQNPKECFARTPSLLLELKNKSKNFTLVSIELIKSFFKYNNCSKRTRVNLVSGFTLVEMLIYVSLVTLITFIAVQSLILVLKSNRTSFAEVNLRNSGYSAMEGILREIYASESIATTSAGVLQMNQNGSTNIVKFATSSNTLYFYEGSSTPVAIGPLTSKGISVKSLIFTPINTGKSYAVRIQMQLETTVNGITKSEWFYSTAILRGSY